MELTSMTREELAQHDGREGRRAYAAINGKVYDFTDSRLWRQGEHAGQHQAGVDLSEDLRKAPHVRAVIERFPVVAVLAASAPPPARRMPTAAIVGVLLLAIVAFYLLF